MPKTNIDLGSPEVDQLARKISKLIIANLEESENPGQIQFPAVFKAACIFMVMHNHCEDEIKDQILQGDALMEVMHKAVLAANEQLRVEIRRIKQQN